MYSQYYVVGSTVFVLQCAIKFIMHTRILVFQTLHLHVKIYLCDHS